MLADLLTQTWYVVPGVFTAILSCICVFGFMHDAYTRVPKSTARRRDARRSLISLFCLSLCVVWPVILVVAFVVLIVILVRWSIQA